MYETVKTCKWYEFNKIEKKVTQYHSICEKQKKKTNGICNLG